jgi:mono/diheme cytochrome c family protein
MWLLALGLGLAGCAGRASTSASSITSYPTLDAARVNRGREVYQQNCVICHGANAEGAINWATPGPDGLYPPPPHDDTGHTWHHSDRVLYETIRDGMNDPLQPGSPLRMPMWGGKLTDAEIRAVIEYFRSLWTEEHRQYQWDETLKDFKPTPTPFSLDGTTPTPVPLPILSADVVRQGRQIYVQDCAACHGPNAEGEDPQAVSRNAQGVYPAPPHDDTGHTWHHPDEVLRQNIRDGIEAVPGLFAAMPAFGGKLSDREIDAVIIYFKSLWTEEHRRLQVEITVLTQEHQ